MCACAHNFLKAVRKVTMKASEADSSGRTKEAIWP